MISTLLRPPGQPFAFLVVSPTQVAVADVAWFEDHWSREAGWSRWRKGQQFSIQLLDSGSTVPLVFSVSNPERIGRGSRDGHQFTRYRAELVFEDITGRREHQFHYWQYEWDGGGPDVEDPEMVRFPLTVIEDGEG